MEDQLVVDKEKKNPLKETLEWLHHAYWIREFLLSSGFWAISVNLFSRYFPGASYLRWPLILFLVGASMYLLDWYRRRGTSLPQVQSSAALLTANNARSDLETLTPGIDIDRFLRLAYRSQAIERETQKNMRILARQKGPEGAEAFYLEFIGVGFMAALFDSIWYPMFRSQLLALLEINRNAGILPMEKLRSFYDAASQEYPQEYASDSFERWLSYLTNNLLVLRHPSDMVEITVRGKEFLKFLTHGDASQKINGFEPLQIVTPATVLSNGAPYRMGPLFEAGWNFPQCQKIWRQTGAALCKATEHEFGAWQRMTVV
jgi:hypothetical protein